MISGPNPGSFVAPTIVSTPSGAISWTTTPSISDSRPRAASLCAISVHAVRTAAASDSASFTPPTSLLCEMLFESSFTATGYPMPSAAWTAASIVAARVAAGVRIP